MSEGIYRSEIDRFSDPAQKIDRFSDPALRLINI